MRKWLVAAGLWGWFSSPSHVQSSPEVTASHGTTSSGISGLGHSRRNGYARTTSEVAIMSTVLNVC